MVGISSFDHQSQSITKYHKVSQSIKETPMKLDQATIQDLTNITYMSPRKVGFIVKQYGMPLSHHPTVQEAEDAYRDQSNPTAPMHPSLTIEVHSLPHILTLAYHASTDTFHLFPTLEGASQFFGYSYSTLYRYAKRESYFADGWRFIRPLNTMFTIERTLFSRKISPSQSPTEEATHA